MNMTGTFLVVVFTITEHLYLSPKQLVKGKDLVYYNTCLTEFVSLWEGK